MRNLWPGISVVVIVLAAFVGQRLQFKRESGNEEEWNSEAIEEERQYYCWAMEHRERVLDALIGDTITLQQAASQFGWVESLRPSDRPPSYLHCPGDTTEEKLCRHVFDYVSRAHVGDSRWETVAKRLERELSARFETGPPRLPNLAPSTPQRFHVATKYPSFGL